MSRRQSSRFTSVAPEQQITQFLIENPLVNSILEDDADRVESIFNDNRFDVTKHDQERQTPLHYAAFIGNPDICLSLIRNGAQIDPKDQDGFTPLHRACAADRNEAVGILLQSGAIAENRNKNWETAWHIASAHGAVSCLQKLLPHITNVNIQDRSGRSALHHASVKGHDQVTEFLIANGANIANFDKQDRRAIHWAALSGHCHVVALLLTKNAEVNCFDKNRFTPIHLAAANGYSQVVEQLIQHGANVNLSNINADTPLHLASKRAQTDCIQLLLQSGAKINMLNKSRYSALHYSVVSGSNEIDEDSTLHATNILLQAGAEIKQDYNGQTPLHWAVRRAAERQIQLLLQHRKQSVNIYDNLGNNALHYAVRSGNEQKLFFTETQTKKRILTYLIDSGCDVNMENKDGATPLHIAAQYSTKLLVTRLLQCGALPKFDNLGRSVLHYAALGGQIEILDVLRNVEPSIDRCCENGKTLLHYAAQGLHPEMIDLILRLTPPETVNMTDKKRRTALHLAAANYDYLACRRLIPNSKYHVDEVEFFQAHEAQISHAEQQSSRCCEILLQHGATVDILDTQNFTPLHYAAASNNSSLIVLHKKGDSNISLVSLLIVSSLNGCNKTISIITQMDPTSFYQRHPSQNGYDAIYCAAWQGNSHILDMMLEELQSEAISRSLTDVSDVFAPGPQGRNAIHAAAINGHLNCLQTLISHLLVANVHADRLLFGDESGRTALHYVALYGHEYCLEPLLELKNTNVNVMTRDNRGHTVFHCAALSGSSDIISLLVQQRASFTTLTILECLLELDNRGQSPLQIAASCGHVDMVAQLITLCPKALNHHDKAGLTPMSHAAAVGRVKVVEVILQYCTKNKFVLVDPCHARSFLAATKGGHVQIISLLKNDFVSKGSTDLFNTWFKTTNKLGQSPIHVAAKNDDVICLNTLLAISKLIDGNFHDELANVDDQGYNPLHIAVKHKSINVCRELLEIDKNGRLQDQAENKAGNSPLQLAILARNELFAEEIAKRCDADHINHRNFQGETSLHMAGRAGMASGILEVVRTLLSQGGDCFAFDDEGRLPLFSLAQSMGQLTALYDFFETMVKHKNKQQLAQLMEGMDESTLEGEENSTRYITHLSVSGSNSQLESSNGILSLQSSISSYRRSSHARSSNRFSSERRSESLQQELFKTF